MIKILVISNLKCNDLSEFLGDRGTFDVVARFTSISENIQAIQNDIIKVDKMLYLYQTDDEGVFGVNFKSEMQYLQKLLESNSFFDPGDIVFLTQTSSQCKKAVKYFESVMHSTKYPKYAVKVLDDTISYIDVYNVLIGDSENSNFNNTYRTLYRKEIDEDSSVMYNRTKNFDDVIEPFNFENIKAYDDQKRFLAHSDDTVIFRDSPSDGETFQNPVLSTLDVDATALHDRKFFIVSGKSKSGASTWCSALACSASKSLNSVLVLDFSKNADIAYTLKECNVLFNTVTMKELLQHDTRADNSFDVLTPCNDKEYHQRINFIRKLTTLGVSKYDSVFVLTELDDLADVVPVLSLEIKKVILTLVPRYTDIIELQEFIDVISDFSVMIVLNEFMQLGWEDFVSPSVIKELLVFWAPKIVKSVTFDTVDIGEKLFRLFSES